MPLDLDSESTDCRMNAESPNDLGEPAADVSRGLPARSPLLAAWGMVTGLLLAFEGFLLAGFGAGFVNATASGTGVAGLLVGLWMVLAVRGVARRRLVTFIGLGLAWVWLIGRVIYDLPATSTNLVVLTFMAPSVGIPVHLGLAAFVITGGPIALARTVGVYRSWQRRRSLQRSSPSLWPMAGVAVRIASIVAATLAVPHLVWSTRDQQIDELAQRYARLEEGQAHPVDFGACTIVFLGYQLTDRAASAKSQAEREARYEQSWADAMADLSSVARAGARYVRVGASGDHLLEEHADQEVIDDRYMTEVRRTGIPLVLVDCQHPKVLGKRRLDWSDFCRFQRRRIEYYQRRYHPAVYFVACEPMTYHTGVLSRETAFSADAWATQLSAMCRLVKSIDTTTRTGICLLVMENSKPEWKVWSVMRNLPELDILGVEVYQPKNFGQTQERLETFGHPRATGKAFWIAETYNGWALASERRWDQDAAWLKVADSFAGGVTAEAVLVWTFGAFVPQGSFYHVVNGTLHEHWQGDERLSPVGQAFADLQRRPRSNARQ